MSNRAFDIQALSSKLSEGNESAERDELIDLLNLPKSGGLLEQSCPKIMSLALKYAQLAAIPHPSEAEADCILEILEAANHINVLSFWIAEIDHFLGHHLGLLDEDDRESYQDQQALLRERCGSEANQICYTPPSEKVRLHMRKASLALPQ